MRSYGKAEKLGDADDPEAILRWNSCARVISRAEARKQEQSVGRDIDAEYSDDVPDR